jgi:hypothetical protein
MLGGAEIKVGSGLVASQFGVGQPFQVDLSRQKVRLESLTYSK